VLQGTTDDVAGWKNTFRNMEVTRQFIDFKQINLHEKRSPAPVADLVACLDSYIRLQAFH
jgi:hypothetical protein